VEEVLFPVVPMQKSICISRAFSLFPVIHVVDRLVARQSFQGLISMLLLRLQRKNRKEKLQRDFTNHVPRVDNKLSAVGTST
jgi:hypothetical protein